MTGLSLLQQARAVVVLHGDPVLPPWLDALARLTTLTLVVNDPGPGRYTALPPAARVLINERPRGFAANVNAVLGEVGEVLPAFLLCANFDLSLEVCALERLLDALDAHPRAGIAGPLLSNFKGEPVFSAGTRPTATKEFLRAAGLRGPHALQLQRAVLRRTSGWKDRNAAGLGTRTLTAQEYLPWTAVALRTTAWKAVGPLDERFELYAEDLDWGVRLAASDGEALLVDAGPVIHTERATRGPRTSAVYEVSHRRLHQKHGWVGVSRWHARGLVVRRRSILRWLTERLDWAVIDERRGLHG